MGTRHLIAAVIDGDFKIAQYGQWDGYPDGQGVDVLRFVRDHDMAEFAAKLRQTTWITPEQITEVNATSDWVKVFPHLSRDAGSEILGMVLAAESPLSLTDQRGFGGNSLMCEWAYVVDLDAKKLEVYRGFNQSPTAASSRFPSGADWLEKSAYEPVKLVKIFDFANLPSDEDFIATLNDEDDAEINWGGQMASLIEQATA